jgi:tetratricopeptide (TPR) repeat protein
MIAPQPSSFFTELQLSDLHRNGWYNSIVDNERVQFLTQAIQSNPDDTFARYALALEFARAGQPEAALEHFRYLLEHHPDYSATYYQAGVLLTDRGRIEEARRVFQDGIAVTRRLGQAHALGELQAALESLD